MSDVTGLATRPSDEQERQRILNRLKRLEGQVRGLQSMIAAGQDCDAVLTQVMAAKSALNQVGLRIIGYSMKTCLLSPDARSRDEIVDEALSVLLRFVNLPDTWAPIEDAAGEVSS
jgi:CsoR family transcriptional regulator, copper-sensing transcriptional repressor